jgi:hypothetical protein
MGVVDRKRGRQAGVKILGRIVITALEQPPRQDAQPPRHLMEPGAMRGRTVHDMRMGRITHASASLDTVLQGLGSTREIPPRRDHATHSQAPVGLEGIDHPIVALHSGPWVDTVAQMGGPIRTGAGLAQMPPAVSRRHHA